MAKRQTEEPEALPGLHELLHGPKPQPKPGPEAGPAVPDEELLGPLPQPGEAPRPEAVKVRVKAGTGPQEKKEKKKAPPPTDFQRFKAWIGPYLIPTDPVDRMRYKLRWLGLTRYIFVPIIAVAVSALIMTYIWSEYLDYSDYVMFYSRNVWSIVFLLPAGIGLALAVYLPVSLFLLNRYEYRWNRTLRDMLRGKIPTKKKKAQTPTQPPKEPAAPEEPLPQPTVNS